MHDIRGSQVRGKRCRGLRPAFLEKRHFEYRGKLLKRQQWVPAELVISSDRLPEVVLIAPRKMDVLVDWTNEALT